MESVSFHSSVPYSAACERNKEAILNVLAKYLIDIDSVLEIGSGTGQHAVYFAQNMPHLTWQTSDMSENIAGVELQIDWAGKVEHQVGSLPSRPHILSVEQRPWFKQNRQFSSVYSANTLHIMSWAQIELFFSGLSQVLNEYGYLFIYGPFKYANQFTSQSNAEFDAMLRSRGCGSAIRDFEEVNALASEVGLILIEDISMPANNQCIVWQKR